MQVKADTVKNPLMTGDSKLKSRIKLVPPAIEPEGRKLALSPEHFELETRSKK